MGAETGDRVRRRAESDDGEYLGGCLLPARSWGNTVVQAYVLIQSEVGKADKVAAAAASLPGVISAEDVTGPYDVIVKAEAANMDDLGKLVVAKIQTVEGITRTLTCPIVRL